METSTDSLSAQAVLNSFSTTSSFRHPLQHSLQWDSRLTWPSKWNTNPSEDIEGLLDISEFGVRYTGPEFAADSDAASTRADTPVPIECGIYYFEVKVVNQGRAGYIGIGFCTEDVKLGRLPGWEQDSYGYHGDDGKIFQGCGLGKPFGPKFGTGDTVGCCLDLITGSISYFLNGSELGVAFRGVKQHRPLFPCVGLNTAREELLANFGHRPFQVDVSVLYNRARSAVLEQMAATTLRNSHHQMLQLIQAHLLQQGCWKTAQMVRRDLQDWNDSAGGGGGGGGGSDSNTDMHDDDTSTGRTSDFDSLMEFAQKRSEIVQLVSKGEIASAMTAIQEYAPGFLEVHQTIRFQLACQKVIEVVRSRDEAQATCNSHPTGLSSGCDLLELVSEVNAAAPRSGEGCSSMGPDNEEDVRTLQEVLALLVMPPSNVTQLNKLLDLDRRFVLGDEVNKALLDHYGCQPISPLEQLHRQVVALRDLASEERVGTVACIEIRKDIHNSD